MPPPEMAASPVDQYLAGVSESHRATLEKLRQTIRSIVPEAEECLSYGLAGFRWKGRPLAAFGAWSSHCALYPMSSTVLAAFETQLKKFALSKGTIRFTANNPLPATLVKKLIQARMAEITGKERPPSVSKKSRTKERSGRSPR